MLTNAFVAVDRVDPDAVEAARGAGHERRPDPVEGRDPARGAADVRRHPHRRGLRDRDGDAGRAGRRRRARRHHRQPADLRDGRRHRRLDRGHGARLRRRGRVRRAAAGDDPEGAAAHGRLRPSSSSRPSRVREREEETSPGHEGRLPCTTPSALARCSCSRSASSPRRAAATTRRARPRRSSEAAGQARRGQAADHDRHQGLHRGVHPRRALRPGAARPRATPST